MGIAIIEQLVFERRGRWRNDFFVIFVQFERWNELFQWPGRAPRRRWSFDLERRFGARIRRVHAARRHSDIRQTNNRAACFSIWK